jgi:hypothetical protein
MGCKVGQWVHVTRQATLQAGDTNPPSEPASVGVAGEACKEVPFEAALQTALPVHVPAPADPPPPAAQATPAPSPGAVRPPSPFPGPTAEQEPHARVGGSGPGGGQDHAGGQQPGTRPRHQRGVAHPCAGRGRARRDTRCCRGEPSRLSTTTTTPPWSTRHHHDESPAATVDAGRTHCPAADRLDAGGVSAGLCGPAPALQ